MALLTLAHSKNSRWTRAAAIGAIALGALGTINAAIFLNSLLGWGYSNANPFALLIGDLAPMSSPAVMPAWYFLAVAAVNAGQLLPGIAGLKENRKSASYLLAYQVFYLASLTGLNFFFSNGDFLFPLSALEALAVFVTLCALLYLGRREA